MKTSLAHLPKHKKAELKVIVNIIKNIIPDVEMIILFGSYARGSWVEDLYTEGHITYEYKSDYDILIVVNNNKQAKDISLHHKVEKQLRTTQEIKTRTNIIIHCIDFFNKKISIGSYFFTDIRKEGIMLYNSQNFKLSRRKRLNLEERKKHAVDDFEYWFESANGFYSQFENALNNKSYNIAAFELHQATERYYHAILLVFTGYKPKLHDIEELGKQAVNLAPEFISTFPINSQEEKRLFDLLKSAYIDARYKRGFLISPEELTYLSTRVQKLKELTERICKEKINSFHP